MGRGNRRSLLLVAAAAALTGCGATATQAANPSGPQWLLQEETHASQVIPVRWSDGARLPAFAVPRVNGKPVDVRGPSPDGRLFLTTITTPQGDVKAVVDRNGTVVRQLIADAMYVWATDSATLCLIHDADGTAGDMRAGVLPVNGGPERDVYTFKADPRLGLHALLACSVENHRMVAIELERTGADGGSPLVRHVVSIDFGGAVVGEHDIPASTRVAVRVSPDALLWAEDPFDLTQPAIVRSTAGDRTVATLPGRGVRAFDGSGTAVLTQSAHPVQGDHLYALQLESLRTGAVLWRQTASFNGALAAVGQPGLVLELAGSSAMHTDVVQLDGRGVPRLTDHNAFLG